MSELMSDLIPDERAAAPSWAQHLMVRLADERDSVLDAIWEQLRLLPAYQGLTDVEAANVRSSIRLVFDILTECLAARRSRLLPEESARLAELGAMRARQGLPIEDVADGFNVGFEHCERRLRELVEEHPPPSAWESDELFGLLRRLHPRTEFAIRDGYLAESGAVACSPGHREARAGLLEALLDDDPNRLSLREFATHAGHPVTGQCGLVLAVGAKEPLEGIPHRLADELAAAVPGAVAAAVHLDPVPHVMVFTVEPWPAPESVSSAIDDIASAHGATVAVLLTGVDELAMTYRRLRPLVQHARLMAGGSGVLSLDLLAIYRMRAAIPEFAAHEVIRETWGGLDAVPRQRWAPWLRTLKIYLQAHGKIGTTAERVPCDRSTVTDHLDRIQEFTGLDARDSVQRLRIADALLLSDLHHVNITDIEPTSERGGS